MSKKFTTEEKQVVDKFISGFKAKLTDIELSEDFETLEKTVNALADALEEEDFAKNFEELCNKHINKDEME